MSKLGKVQTTGHGFDYIEFMDQRGDSCSLQQSSARLLAGAGAIWLGLGSSRMHLDAATTLALIVELQSWIDTGGFTK